MARRRNQTSSWPQAEQPVPSVPLIGRIDAARLLLRRWPTRAELEALKSLPGRGQFRATQPKVRRVGYPCYWSLRNPPAELLQKILELDLPAVLSYLEISLEFLRPDPELEQSWRHGLWQSATVRERSVPQILRRYETTYW